MVVLALAGTSPATGATRVARTNVPSVSDIAATGGNAVLQGRTKNKFGKPMSQLVDTVMDSCDWAEAMASNYSGVEKWLPAYDTIRWFFDHCYSTANTGELWRDVFPSIAHAILVNYPDSTLSLRSWLMSIRNFPAADPTWYCDVVGAVAGTYPNNAFDRLAIVKFLIDNPHCPAMATFFNFEYQNEMLDTLSGWAHSDPHPNTDTFDSTLPSLHDLGLDSLLHDVAAGVEPSASGSQILLSAHITANPFAQRTSLALLTSREAWFKISVYDVLGRAVDGAGYSGVLEPGSRTIPLVLTNAPPGTYYVRIATANDEVRTLKLTKQ